MHIKCFFWSLLHSLVTLQCLCVLVSASDSGSGGCGFDSQPSHVVIALGKQFTLTFPSPPTCKMGTQLQAMSL